MVSLLPPLIESQGKAISAAGDSMDIFFTLPRPDTIIATSIGGEGIHHIQVIVRNGNSGNYMVSSDYSPDNAIIFLPTYVGNYIEPEGQGYLLHFPYKFFKNGAPTPGVTFQVQIRFGESQLWFLDPNIDPYAGPGLPNFSRFSDWNYEQTSKIPGLYGEWSNIQKVYCHGNIVISCDYNLNDFVPEIIYTYSSEIPDPIRSGVIIYSYELFGNIVSQEILLNGNTYEGGTYSFSEKILIAPLTPINVTVLTTTEGGVLNQTSMMIPAITPGGLILPPISDPLLLEDSILYGEEKEDGLLAKQLSVSGHTWENLDTLAIYRVDVFNLETIKLKDNIILKEESLVKIRDYSIEMGKDYQYIAILKKAGKASNQVSKIFPFGTENSGYGRQTYFNSIFLTDNLHQLKIQGNIKVSNFKRNTSDVFQTTLGSSYPFYSRIGNTNYRTLQIGGVITINSDLTSSFFRYAEQRGLEWIHENGSSLVILNRDLFGEDKFSLSRVRMLENNTSRPFIEEYGNENIRDLRGPSSIYDGYYARYTDAKIGTDRSDSTVFAERKFREYVMQWLSNGAPKMLRSETEGNMIIVPSGISFSPLDKSGRIVYEVSMTLTEIDEWNLKNLIKYQLVPVEIETYELRNFYRSLSLDQVIPERDYHAILYFDINLSGNFIPVEEGYKVIDLKGLQEVLDQINEYSFLRGDPQPPIMEGFYVT